MTSVYAESDELLKPDIESILGQALTFLRAGKTDRALACLSACPVTRDHSFACYLAGLIHVNIGQDGSALPFYDRALQLKPNYSEALEGRARILQRAGRFDEAIAAYEALFRFHPASAGSLHNLGSAFERAGRKTEALDCYERSLEGAPDYLPALLAKALVLHGLGHDRDALQACRQLAAVNPADATSWYNCGVILAACGEQAEAYDYFREALERVPGYGLALYGAATALQKLGRLEEALAVCEKLPIEAPPEFKTLFLRGNILFGQGRAAEALAAFDEALALNSNDLGALCNRGATLRQLGRLAEAAAMFDEALAKNPRCVEALLGRGIVEFKSARIEEALLSFTSALEADPASATALCGRGLALQELGRIDEALADFERSLASDPGLVEGHSNLGALQLLLGEFERGWEGYEYRKLAGDECKAGANALWPVWNGEAIDGKKLLVLDEAAHGDIVMLARYFPMLAGLGADVTFKCRARMVALLKNVPGVRLVTETGHGDRFDYQAHLFSLPRAFKTRLETIPARVLYIEAEPVLTARWAARLGSQGFKIGVAWQGNPDPKVDMARAAPLAAFAPLARLPNVRLISLQKGFGTGQIASSGVMLETLGEDFDSGPHAFLDTAAVMANLDLIVSVDTSVAHLAGAMGRPVFVALKHVPEWRWMLGRSDSPWYPTMRLFRQSVRGDWSGVFGAMAKAVETLTADGEAKPAAAPLLIPAAIGELVDKLTILEIKAERIPDPRKLANVERELSLLDGLRKSRGLSGAHLDSLAAELKRTNLALWDIEDSIRRCERLGDFGPDFVALARSVYKENDKRAALKRKLNELFASVIVEEKYFPEDYTKDC
ncbi:MAG: tetratricopeptide repeat protein [Rhodomicrobium sp.]